MPYIPIPLCIRGDRLLFALDVLYAHAEELRRRERGDPPLQYHGWSPERIAALFARPEYAGIMDCLTHTSWETARALLASHAGGLSNVSFDAHALLVWELDCWKPRLIERYDATTRHVVEHTLAPFFAFMDAVASGRITSKDLRV